MKIIAKIIDTETTGMTNSDRMFEYAHLVLPKLEELRTVSPIYAHTAILQERSIWNPDIDIHPQATAVHGYTKEMLKQHPHADNFTFECSEYVIGHNVDFDCRYLGEPDTKRICTIRLAKQLWPKTAGGVTSYKLTNLIEHFVEGGKQLTKEAHGALSDCFLTLILLEEILKRLPRITSWEELYQFQLPKSKPAPKEKKTLDVMPFGKYKGELFCDIPEDYIRWALDNMELKADLRSALQGAYGLRGK